MSQSVQEARANPSSEASSEVSSPSSGASGCSTGNNRGSGRHLLPGRERPYAMHWPGRVAPDLRKVVSIGVACQMAGVSRRTIYNWLTDGKLEWWRTVGGSLRIVEATLWEKPR